MGVHLARRHSEAEGPDVPLREPSGVLEPYATVGASVRARAFMCPGVTNMKLESHRAREAPNWPPAGGGYQLSGDGRVSSGVVVGRSPAAWDQPHIGAADGW